MPKVGKKTFPYTAKGMKAAKAAAKKTSSMKSLPARASKRGKR
jgi:hypothetical protein